VAVLVNPFAGGAPDPLASAVALGGALSWGCGSVYARRAAHPAQPLLGSGMQLICAGVILCAAGAAAGELGRIHVGALAPTAVLALGYLIVFGSLVAYTSYEWLIRHAPSPLVGTYAFVNPVVAVLLGWWLLREQVSARTILAAAVIVAGVALIVLRRPPARPRPSADRSVLLGGPLGHGDHADRLGLGHPQLGRDHVGGLPLGLGQRPVGHPDPHRLGQEPLPGVRGELPGHLAERRAAGLRRLGDIGVEVTVGVVAGAGALDGGHGPLPGRRVARMAGLEHGRGSRAHAGRQGRLHRGGGRLLEHVHDVARLAGRALHVLPGPGQRDHGDEEQGEEPAPGAVPVLPVTAALTAVKDALAQGPEERPEPEDDEQR
jgi:hypothetical protein